MPPFLLELIVLLLLIVINGTLSMAEMAVVSARKPRLQQMADEGNEAAGAVLAVAINPGDFLSTVQVGITLIGVLTGAFGGATLSGPVAAWLATIPLLAPYAELLAVVLVVLITTYLSLVVGELVPKRIALNDAEKMACSVIGPMRTLSRFSRPVVHVLNLSSEGLLRVLGIKPPDGPTVTDEEVKVLLQQGTQDGIFDPLEQEIMGSVFRLSDRNVSAIMTPRTDITWLDVDDNPELIRSKIREAGHSRYPLARGTLDNVIGVVMVKDLVGWPDTKEAVDLVKIAHAPLYVPETMPALEIVKRLRETGSHMALVIDEYGGLAGLVSISDLMVAILGNIADDGIQVDKSIVQREDGTWLVDGMLPVDEFQEHFDLKALPKEDDVDYQTVGGMIMAMLERVPTVGSQAQWETFSFEVVDMDGRRVDKIMVARLPEPEPEAPPKATARGRRRKADKADKSDG